MAGEIFIADKETLDRVKTDTEGIRVGTNAANSKLDSLLDKSYITVEDLTNNKLVYTYANSQYAMTPIDLTNAKGTLYFIIAHSVDVAYLKVTVDGSVIFWRNVADTSSNPMKSGIIVAGSLLQSTTSIMQSDTDRRYINTYVLPSGISSLVGSVLVKPNSVSEPSRGVLLLQKPLKFNSSLKIEYLPVSSGTFGHVDICYLLD